jgi:NAD(P)-dependent dehydrogenase (short-subunit alcohol dehydrogenase family)
VTSQSEVDDVAAHCGEGGVALVANVAGVLDDFSPVGEVSDEMWERVLAVNLTGVMRITRAFVPAMVRAGGGVIVNVSSIGGVRGGIAGAAYTASKHGVIGLSRSTAYLYASSGIRCNVVCPGAVDTPLGQGVIPAAPWAIDHIRRVMPRIDKRADPEQIAAIISWLGSADAAIVNGAVVTADGGWTAG